MNNKFNEFAFWSGQSWNKTLQFCIEGFAIWREYESPCIENKCATFGIRSVEFFNATKAWQIIDINLTITEIYVEFILGIPL